MATSTWRILGLSVAASYTGLGLFEILFPHRAAAELFALPPRSQSKQHVPDPQVSEAVSLMIPLLGVRDLSLAAAMYVFAWEGKWREVGTVILSGMILCAADSAVVWKRLGPKL